MLDTSTLAIRVESTGIKEASNSLSGLSTTANNTEKRITALGLAMDKLKNNSVSSIAAMQAVTTQLQTQLALMQGLNTNANGAATATTALAAAMTMLSTALTTVSNNQQNVIRHQREHNEAMKEAHAFARGLSGAFGALWMTYGNLAGMFAGVAIGAGLKEAVTGFAKVEYQMTFVKALAEDTTHTVAQLTTAMHEVAMSLGINPEEASKGLRALTQAGLTTEEALKTLPVAFKLATVGELELGAAALAMTGVMNAYGKSVNDLEHIGDVMAKAGAMSAASVDSISVSMKYAAGTAEQYGVSLEKLGTMLTMLGKRGITGSSAGVAANNLIAELYSPSSEKAIKAQAALGVKSYVGGVRQEIEVVMASLKDGLAKYDSQSQGILLEAMFGKKGGKAFYAMAQASKEDFLKMTQDLVDSTGFTAKVFAENLKTLEGQASLTKSAVTNMFAKIGEESSEPLKVLLTEIRNLANMQEVQDALVGLAQSIKFLATTFLPVAAAAGGMFLAFKVGTGVIAALTTAFEALVAFNLASTIGKIGAAFFTLNPVIVTVIGAVTLLAAGWALLHKNTDSVHEQHAKTMDQASEVNKKLREEVELLEKKNGLRRQGINDSEMDAVLKAKASEDNVTRIQDRMNENTNLIEGREKGTLKAILLSRENKQLATDLAEAKRQAAESATLAARYKEAKATEKSQQDWRKTQDSIDEMIVNPSIGLAGKSHYNQGDDKKQKAPKLTDYQRLDKELNEHKAVLDASFDSEDKLTEGEKKRAKVISDIVGGYLKMTPQEQANTIVKLNAIVAEEEQLARWKESQAEMEKRVKTIDAETKTVSDRADKNENLIATFGKSKDAIRAEELARLQAQLAQKESVGLCNAETAALRELIQQKEREYKTEAELVRLKKHKTPEEGFNNAIKKYRESAEDLGGQIETATTNALSNMEDAFVEFAKTGKLNFSSLADSIISDIIRIQVKMMMTGSGSGGGGLLGALGNIGMSLFGPTGAFGSNAGLAASQGLSMADIGSAFAEGGEPPMGKISLVGEQGPELFVPHQAGTIIPNDKISIGGEDKESSGSSISVNYSPVINIDSRTDRAEVADLMKRAIKQSSAELVEKLSRQGRI